jgi:hypothetical protein
VGGEQSTFLSMPLTKHALLLLAAMCLWIAATNAFSPTSPHLQTSHLRLDFTLGNKPQKYQPLRHAQSFWTPRIVASRLHGVLAKPLRASQGVSDAWDAWRSSDEDESKNQTSTFHSHTYDDGFDTWDAWRTRGHENRTSNFFRSRSQGLEGLEEKNAGQDASLSALKNSGQGDLDDISSGPDDGSTGQSALHSHVKKNLAGSAFDGPNMTAMVHGDILDLLQVCTRVCIHACKPEYMHVCRADYI